MEMMENMEKTETLVKRAASLWASQRWSVSWPLGVGNGLTWPSAYLFWLPLVVDSAGASQRSVAPGQPWSLLRSPSGSAGSWV